MSKSIYFVTQLHNEIEIWKDGVILTKLDFSDTADLAAMLTRAAEMARAELEEDMADARSEQLAYDNAERLMDGLAELRADKNGWN